MNLALSKNTNTFVITKSFSRNTGYTRSPFRYPGGKFYALKFIIPMLDCVPHDEFREPFVGGGSVFFGKTKAKHNWINDLESNLIATYTAIKDDSRCKWLSKKVSQEVASRDRHFQIKNLQPKNQDEVAFRTYYLNRTSYSGIINAPAWGYAIGKSSPPNNWPNFLLQANEKLKGTKITCLDFEKVIGAKSDRKVLMYLDPPYYKADQKRAYIKSFNLDDHHRLQEVLKKTQFNFCLSYDDCKEVRDLYKWANVNERQWFYNTANSAGSRMLGNELIITNYEVINDCQRSLFNNYEK
jgi:DNA adenine methylase